MCRFRVCRGCQMSGKRGFTLVELLVVIAIIALLMSILMPALARVRQQAKNTLCHSNLRQWGLIFQMFAEDHEGLFDEFFTDTWLKTMDRYYEENQALTLCPMATKLQSEGARGAQSAWGIFPMFDDAYGSYGLNNWASNPTDEELPDPYDSGWFWRSPYVKQASKIPLFVDCYLYDVYPTHEDQPPEFDGDHFSILVDEMKMICMDRHNGYVNGVFMDFTVREMGLKQLWQYKWHREFDLDGGPTMDYLNNYGTGWLKWFKDY